MLHARGFAWRTRRACEDGSRLSAVWSSERWAPRVNWQLVEMWCRTRRWAVPPCASKSEWRVLHGVNHGGHMPMSCLVLPFCGVAPGVEWPCAHDRGLSVRRISKGLRFSFVRAREAADTR